MRKILTIANREYRAMVGTKAFLVTIGLMPILMMGGMLVPKLMKQVQKTEDKRIVVIDRSNALFEIVQQAADERNRDIDATVASGKEDNGFDLDDPRLVLEPMDPAEVDDERLLELSNQVRKGDLYAFVDIPADVLTSDAQAAANVQFYSQDAPLSEARRWFRESLNRIVRLQRLQNAGIDPLVVMAASIPINVKALGLLERAADGSIIPGEEADDMMVVFLPFIIMMLMFIVVFMSAQPMLESVLEEKSQRIAEVLLGSTNPFQLMAGKLLGNVGGSLTVFVLYACGAYLVANSMDVTDDVPFEIIPWFIIYQVLAVLFFSSIFMAIGACVTQLKEAQSMLMPVWFLLMTPLFVWIYAIKEPNGALATGLSLFPPATPLLMVLRLSTGATIPTWQPLVGIVGLVLTTLVVIWAAGRIFQIGILWQGKTPKMSDLVGWVVRRDLN